MSWFTDLFGHEFENKISKLKDQIMCDDNEHKERVNTCLQCEHYNKSMQMCQKCYCIVPIKTKIKAFHCPINKW